MAFIIFLGVLAFGGGGFCRLHHFYLQWTGES